MFELPTTETGKPKLYTDAFKKDCFKQAAIFIYPDTVRGNIEFKNGSTEGILKFAAQTLPDIIQQMDAFMKSL